VARKKAEERETVGDNQTNVQVLGQKPPPGEGNRSEDWDAKARSSGHQPIQNLNFKPTYASSHFSVESLANGAGFIN
jgi:hypothetical protein